MDEHDKMSSSNSRTSIISYVTCEGIVRTHTIFLVFTPSRSGVRKKYSENMQQIYRRTPMPKFGFNKIASQLY